jgi:uncharacterized protein YneF (UPF0154 family)
MYVILAIVCIVLFLLSFAVLFHKQLGIFFSAIGRIFKKIFNRKKKPLPPVSTEQKRVVLKKPESLPVGEGQTEQIKQSPVEENKENSDDRELFEELEKRFGQKNTSEKQNAEILNRYELSQENLDKRSQLDEQRKRMDKEINDLNVKFKRFNFGDTTQIPEFLQKKSEDTRRAILEKDKDDFLSVKPQKTSAEIEIDKEKIDLSKLPPNIKKLLISGILDKKDF